MSKPQVRELAREAALPVAEKRESQDLCFVAGLGPRGFIRRHGGRRLAERRGDIVDRAGRRLGGHDGQHLFTVGQRRGLGVAAEEPLYVLSKDAAHNQVVVGPRDQLGATRVSVEDARLHRRGDRVSAVKLRYRSRRGRLPGAAAIPRPATTPRSSWHWSGPSRRSRPVRPRSCSTATWSSARRRSRGRREHGPDRADHARCRATSARWSG